MADLEQAARRMVEALEADELDTVHAAVSEELADWDPRPWLAGRWRPSLTALAGEARRVDGTRAVNPSLARVVLVGERGRAYVSVRMTEDGRVAGLGIDPDEADGRFTPVFNCAEDQEPTMAAFYAALVGARSASRIGFGEGPVRPPRWGDPDRPAQLHLDVEVADLDTAEQQVLSLGATTLAELPGRRVYTDPAGHPFCLYPGSGAGGESDGVGRWVRVVIDTDDPAPLARFWGGLLDLPDVVSATADRIEIGAADGTVPRIAMQRVDGYQPTTWPKPDRPAQAHFDLGFDDRTGADQRVLDLGGRRLPPQGGSCPVFADPAGHPFCLCNKGE